MRRLKANGEKLFTASKFYKTSMSVRQILIFAIQQSRVTLACMFLLWYAFWVPKRQWRDRLTQVTVKKKNSWTVQFSWKFYVRWNATKIPVVVCHTKSKGLEDIAIFGEQVFVQFHLILHFSLWCLCCDQSCGNCRHRWAGQKNTAHFKW